MVLKNVNSLTLSRKKYNPTDSDEHRKEMIDREYAPVCILEMTIEHLSGKEAIELVRMRKKQ